MDNWEWGLFILVTLLFLFLGMQIQIRELAEQVKELKKQGGES